MDSLLTPISFNSEALRILTYPDSLTALTPADGLLAQRIRSSLLSRDAFVSEFRSGRRRYFCRTFMVDWHAKDPSHPDVAVLLERGPSAFVSSLRVSRQFGFTPREGEVLGHLLQGMSSKEIADRMNVSPSTVKGFLRIIMIKTGAASRSGVIGKIMMAQT